MCDTFVVLPEFTKDGSVIFGKNSDRDANEAHQIVIIPRQHHAKGQTLKCTYIEIPQVEETYQVLLSKPFWIWGAEMGANEHNVVIGNEAIFSRIPAQKTPSLIGMDYLRLALERSRTAKQAIEVITGLLAQYGQGGNCGYDHKIFYHNSFLIADNKEAWILETVDKNWVAKKVDGFGSISNGLTIEGDFDLASSDVIQVCNRRKHQAKDQQFNFRKEYTDVIITFGSDANNRQCRTQQLILSSNREFNLRSAFSTLRDHDNAGTPNWSPDKGVFGADVCMHVGVGPVRISQTTGSMVTHIKDGKATHWLTGTAAPCNGIFKPLWMDAGLPDIGPEPGAKYDPKTLWWHHEDLHRAVLQNYAKNIRSYKKERDALERSFINGVGEYIGKSESERKAFSQLCFDQAHSSTKDWIHKLELSKNQSNQRFFHKLLWQKLDKKAERLQ